MAADCRSLLPDPTLLIRGLREKEIDHATGKIRKGAFIPRRNSKDDDGLSVSQPANDSRASLMVRLSNAEGYFCKMLAVSIRLIEEGPITLEVCPDRTDDPYHALIIGIPTSKDNCAIAIRLAERLAAISTQYIPPE